MANGWAARLPRASRRMATDPKPVTFVYPYYENPAFFARQLETWAAYPAALRRFLTVIVVDDGSPRPAVLPATVPVALRLFRIAVDVPWNWLAARNVGAFEAADGWLLLTDMDHVVPTATLEALVADRHDRDVIYAFGRREHTGEAIAPHSASFFLTRRLFWTIGGYDEALSGHYGSDGDFRRRASTAARFELLPNELERHEYVADSSTSRYRRKLPEDTAAIAKIVAARGQGWRPKALSFPYSEVKC